MKTLILAFLSGALFGLGLAVSGMTDPSRVTGFLNITANWDSSLVFVMGGALGTYAFLMFVTRKLKGGKCMNEQDLPRAESEPVSRRLLIGSAMFGIGWGLSGFCPGPALANLSALRAEALVFVPLMLLGMVLANRIFGTDL
ncbi:MAG: DUF6691 family protein [Akkermansiaceae bacterium]